MIFQNIIKLCMQVYVSTLMLVALKLLNTNDNNPLLTRERCMSALQRQKK